MKAFKVKYSHGHFIDVETNLRLIPVQGEEYTITAKDTAFKSEDDKLSLSKILSPETKLNLVERKYKQGGYKKILDSGVSLCFRVGNSKKVSGDESHQYLFQCTLLEDLYLYLIKGKDGKEPDQWRLVECKVQLENCLLGGLSLSEKLQSNSLNSLFSNTVQFYFSLQRAATINVFDSFFIYEEGMNLTFTGATWQHYNTIGKLRENIIKTNFQFHNK